MKGSAEIVELLNEVLTAELTAINQYWVHGRMCQSWGYEKLWAELRAEAIGEMKHADLVVERILYLDGIPNLQRLGNIKIGETVPEQLSLDLALEQAALERLNRGVILCREQNDAGTGEIVEQILLEEEQHADWIETQLGLIKAIGLELYLAQQVRA